MRGVNPKNAEKRIELINATRQTWAQVLGGVFFLVTAYFTWRTTLTADENVKIANKNWEATRNGQITDRFTKAIEQLGASGEDKKAALPKRIGAIYALERVALDSPEYHWPVMQVLTAYARLNARWDGKRQNSDAYPEDIASILTVLGRRDRSHPELGHLDLRFVDMGGADLSEVHFENAYLYGAHLEGAYLFHTHLENAVLIKAHLEGTDLRNCAVTQQQVDSADTDGNTRVNPPLHLPLKAP